MTKLIVSIPGENVLQQLDCIVEQAIYSRASDIHIDIKEASALIRMRLGGHLSFHTYIARSVADALIGRLKLLSGLRIDISDKSQDGSIYYGVQRLFIYEKTAIKKVHMRVATAPTVFGETVVCRLFAFQDSQTFNIDALGIEYQDILVLKRILNQSSGLILVSGPTGSGKTTTLYACLQYLSRQSKVIVTLEDPVEVILPNIRQIKVQSEYGYGFSEALRGVLRQDPDVIMVGEIRDEQTAALAVQAALTGHLILATIHAPSALEIIDRLHSLGIKSDMCASVVSLLMSQRQIQLETERRVVFEFIEFNYQFKSKLLLTSNSASLAEVIQSQGVLLLKDRIATLHHEGLISREDMYKYVR